MKELQLKKEGQRFMSNSIFQTMIHQMKDVVGRTIGVIDENGVIIRANDKVKTTEDADAMLAVVSE